jgi:hypothetical protein
MNAPQHPQQSNNEEWIAKYRAALDATPIHRSHTRRFRAALNDFFRAVAYYLGKLADEWMSAQWLTASAELNPEFPARRELPPLRKDQALVERKGAVRKAS